MKKQKDLKEPETIEDNKEGGERRVAKKIIIGMIIGGILGYLVVNDILGGFIGAILGGYMALKL